MGQTILLDSGVWAANFLEKDDFHTTADRIIVRLIAAEATILVPEIVQAEVLNVVLHRSLDKQKVAFVNNRFLALVPAITPRHGDVKFWNEFLPNQLSRLFLKTLDLLVASYALYWNVDAFYSFDEKLNRAVRRIKPEIVKIKVRHGRAFEV